MLSVKKIAWPTDFSDPSYAAAEAAAELAQRFGAELYALHVVTPVPETGVPASQPPAAMIEYYATLADDSGKALDSTVAERVPTGVMAHSVVLRGLPAEAIARFVDENDIDLVVIATHGRTGFSHLVFGSVAEKVIRLVKRPVLVVPISRE